MSAMYPDCIALRNSCIPGNSLLAILFRLNGASGGPIVNEAGEAIGVISQRAVTSASQSSDTSLKVPAGATIGLSLEPMETVRQIKLRQALTKK